MSVQWIVYKGKRILYQDYRGLAGEALRAAVRQGVQMSAAEPGEVTSLTNVEGIGANPEFLTYVKEERKPVAAKNQTAKQAVVVGSQGVSVFVKKTFVNALITMTGVKLRAFSNEEEAKEWLIS